LVPSYASLSPESNGPGGRHHFPPAADPLAGALLFALLGAEHDEGAGKDRGDPLQDPEPLLGLGDIIRCGVCGDGAAFGLDVGGLPAVVGAAWDIGAPLDDRGASLADKEE